MVLLVGNQFVKNLLFDVHCSIPVINTGGFVSQAKSAQDRVVELSLGKEKNMLRQVFFSFFSPSYYFNTPSFLYSLVFVTYAFSSFQSCCSILCPLAFSFFLYFCFLCVTLFLDYSSHLTSTLNPRYAKAFLWGSMNVWGVLHLFSDRLLYCK